MTIYSATDLASMTDEQRLAALEDLGAKVYGSARYGAEFCRQSGWAPKTLANWRARSSPVPVQAVLLLQEWSGGKTTDRIMVEALADLSRELGGMARTLQRTAREISGNLRDPDATARDDATLVDESRL